MSDRPVLDPASRTDDIRELFRNVAGLRDGVMDPEQVATLCALCPSVDSWRSLISALPLDRLSFHLEVGLSRAEAIRVLSAWCRGFRGDPQEGHEDDATRIRGCLVALLLTLITMEEGTLSFSEARGVRAECAAGEGADQPAANRHNCADICQRLIGIPSVRTVLLGLYAPDDGGAASSPSVDPLRRRQAVEEWERLPADSLTFHRHGSTSFILRGSPQKAVGRQSEYALKCVLLPYANVPVIASKTESYATDHSCLDAEGRPVRHMVQVWASTGRWILMDFVEGVTLAEEIENLKRRLSLAGPGRPAKSVPRPGNVRLDLIRILGLPLLEALSELHRGGKRHEDLSPTNVVVRRRSSAGDRHEYDVTLIDFGRNYLYTRLVGGHEGPDGAFVAPEVRSNEHDVAAADLYSVGRILISLGDVGENRDGTIPDRFYGQAPLIARVIEDLIDQETGRRLLVFGVVSDSADIYGSLRVVLGQELDVTQAELVADSGQRQYAVPYEKESLLAAVRSLYPLNRESKKRRRIYEVRKEQGVLSDPRRSMHARWLLVFSVLAALNYFITAFVSISWFWRDIGFDVLSPPIQTFLQLVGVDSTGVPLVDGLRRPDYHLGEVGENFPARMVGLSFALAGARYYQNILSGLTTRVAGSPFLGGTPSRLVAEIAMRTMAVWPSWLILGSNLIDVRWWAIATAIGYTGVLVTNVSSARFATRYLTMAREHGLSTVPPAHQRISGLDSYRQWGPSMCFYSLSVWVFAILIHLGVLKDVYVYATLVALVNVGLFYIIKTGANALDIRTGLNRCFLAAERLRYEKEQGASALATHELR